MALSRQDLVTFEDRMLIQRYRGALDTTQLMFSQLSDRLTWILQIALSLNSARRYPAVVIPAMVGFWVESYFEVFLSRQLFLLDYFMVMREALTWPSASPPVEVRAGLPTEKRHHNFLFEEGSPMAAEAFEFARVDPRLLRAAVRTEQGADDPAALFSSRLAVLPADTVGKMEDRGDFRLLINPLRRLLRDVSCVPQPHWGTALFLDVAVASGPTKAPWYALGLCTSWPAWKYFAHVLDALVQHHPTEATPASVLYLKRMSRLLLRSTTQPTHGTREPGERSDQDLVPLPPISAQLLYDDDLFRVLRMQGMDVDVAKVCALSDVQQPRFTGVMDQVAQRIRGVSSRVPEVVVGLVGAAVYPKTFGRLSPYERQQIHDDGCKLAAILHPIRHANAPANEMLAKEEYDLRLLDRELGSDDATISLDALKVVGGLTSQRQRIDRHPPPEVPEPIRTLHNGGNPVAPPLSDRFKIEFRGVSFAYPSAGGGGATSNPLILRNVSFTIQQGERVGLIGYSGAGKTTILKLLLRLYLPTSGVILVDNIPIECYPARQLRRRIAFVSQGCVEDLLTWCTLEDNLALGDLLNANIPEAIDRALAQADARDFVEAKPLKLKTYADPELFSGGELQRLLIARALVRHPSRRGVLVLDEATSALDGYTERKVLDAIFGEGGQVKEAVEATPLRSTLLLITHRLATLQRVDRIIVLDQGSIVQEGSWAELANDTEGLFAVLLSSQSVRIDDDDHESPVITRTATSMSLDWDTGYAAESEGLHLSKSFTAVPEGRRNSSGPTPTNEQMVYAALRRIRARESVPAEVRERAEKIIIEIEATALKAAVSMAN
jgi:ABC-type methionine transport system ATPase subunit